MGSKGHYEFAIPVVRADPAELDAHARALAAIAGVSGGRVLFREDGAGDAK